MTITGNSGWWLAAGSILAVALTLRIAGAMAPLTFDELWTLKLITERAPTPFHVFWSVQHDNVHPLYGVYAWFLPNYPDPVLYRLPSVLFGVGTVAVAGLLGRTKPEAVFAMALAAVTYPLVHFGAEARGYGPMMFFLLTAFYVIDRDLATGTRRRRWVAVCMVGAALSQATGLLGVAALILWFTVERSRAEASHYFLPTVVAGLILAVAFAAASLANGFQVGHMMGPEGFTGRFVAGVGLLVKLLAGLPRSFPSWLALIGAGMLAVAAIVAWDRRARLYLIAIAIVLAMFVAAVPPHGFGRYYLFALIFLVPLWAGLFGMGLRTRGKPLALAVALTVVASAAWHSYGTVTNPGDGFPALASAIDKPGTIGTDQPFAMSVILSHYAPERSFETAAQWSGDDAPQWIVLRGEPAPEISLRGTAYQLVKRSEDNGLYRTTWALYRLKAPASSLIP